MTSPNKKRKTDEDKVDQAIEESFPASDPPSYSTPQPKNDKPPDDKGKRDDADLGPNG